MNRGSFARIRIERWLSATGQTVKPVSSADVIVRFRRCTHEGNCSVHCSARRELPMRQEIVVDLRRRGCCDGSFGGNCRISSNGRYSGCRSRGRRLVIGQVVPQRICLLRRLQDYPSAHHRCRNGSSCCISGWPALRCRTGQWCA